MTHPEARTPEGRSPAPRDAARPSGRIAAAVSLAALVLALVACRRTPEVDGRRAYANVVRQVDAGPRVPGTPAHDSIQVWLASELTRLGARVEVQRFADSTLGRPLTLANVVGRYGPDDGRRIALIAHWDTRPWCDNDPDSTKHSDPLPGANDGASGVAVLLEVAELLRHRRPGVGVEIVFVDGEDLGRSDDARGFCRGSREYARRLQRGEGPAISTAFVFDMVGDRDLEIHPEIRSSREATNLVQLVLDGARARGARHFRPDPRWEVYDDHFPLLDAGIPAADIIDFDYPAWHTSGDVPSQVSAESLAEVASVAAWLVFDSPLSRAAR